MSMATAQTTKQEELDELKTVAPANFVPGPLDYQVANLQGIGRRELQEDAFAFGNALDPDAIRRGGLLLVVADGMGGMKGGLPGMGGMPRF